MLTDTRHSPFAKLVPASEVQWTGGLLKEVEDRIFASTVPHLQNMFDAKEISHVVENFRIAAGEAEGEFDGTVFGDGDFYKWMEAATYAAVKTGNQELLDRLEDYIALIGRAQQPDGYLSTKQIIGEKSGNGTQRMGDINDFEVYNFGHMFTSAALYYRMTGRTSFLDIASRTADYLDRLYEEARRTGEVRTAVCPSHYMGLIELYRATGEDKYRRLARTAIELRDSVKDGLDDNQDRIPLKDQRTIIGHAVRANYLYAGLADLCLEEDDAEYKAVLDSVWDDLIRHKLYITGGCGALYNGASPYGNFFSHQLIHQAYGYPYQLPNITAYNETCANVGLVMWSYRMFLREPRAAYFDTIERVMLNTNLASISLDGRKFFYQNALARAKKLEFQLVWPLTRTEYITSYCCPPNLARNLAQSSEYAYAVSGDTVYTGLYGASRVHIVLANGVEMDLVQTTDYPYDGKVVFTFENVQQDGAVGLALRIPEWAESGRITVQEEGHEKAHHLEQFGCYQTVTVQDPASAKITLELGMPIRLVAAHDMVEEDQGKVAVMRGPLVYCIETPDAEASSLGDLRIGFAHGLMPEEETIAGQKITVLKGKAMMQDGTDSAEALYRTVHPSSYRETPIRLIPYFAWDNRGEGEMKIWIPFFTK